MAIRKTRTFLCYSTFVFHSNLRNLSLSVCLVSRARKHRIEKRLSTFPFDPVANHRTKSRSRIRGYPRFPRTRETGLGASVASTESEPHQRHRVSPLLGARRFARWRASMVGWKPLLRQGDAHTVSPNVRSHLHLSTRPSKSLQVPPAIRSSASKPGTPRNRLHSAALPANQIAHSLEIFLAPVFLRSSLGSLVLTCVVTRR